MTLNENFIWGTASSSNQAEGAAPASTWIRWMEQGKAPPTGDGNGFGKHYAEDFKLFKEIGLEHHRLTIEWARIEPEPGKRDEAAIEHYRRMIKAGNDLGLKIWVCFHHFTHPQWFEDAGGFASDTARELYWRRHVGFLAETYGDLAYGWKPINEPIAWAAGAYAFGMWPPGLFDQDLGKRTIRGLLLAMRDAWCEIRNGGKPVASIHALSPAFPLDNSPEAARHVKIYDDYTWNIWLRALREGVIDIPGLPREENVPALADCYDLIGFSYYSARGYRSDGSQGRYPPHIQPGPIPFDETMYAHWPEGLGFVIDRLAKELPGRPLLISELGCATTDPTLDDDRRCQILSGSMKEVQKAIKAGVDLRGVFFWTGIDNYEWNEGYRIKFGLFDIERRPRKSSDLVRRWISNNTIE